MKAKLTNRINQLQKWNLSPGEMYIVLIFDLSA